MTMGLTRRRLVMGMGCVLMAATPVGSVRAAYESWRTLEGVLTDVEARSGGRLGVAILDTATGGRHGQRGGERFPMCSTFKALACGAVLARVDTGREDLDRRVRFTAADVVNHSPVTKERIGGEGMRLGELCAATLAQSDNTAANLILASLGGPPALTSFARALGDPLTRLDRTETSLDEATPGDPRDSTTPDAMAANLRALVLGDVLSRPSRDQLVTWMRANQTGDAKLRAGLPKDWRVADRTGGGDHGTTNDVAVFWPPGRAPLVVCVYMTETTLAPEVADALFAAIGRAVASRA